MNTQTFEILCPVCGAVVPAEASGCLNCAEKRDRARKVEETETPTAAERSRAAELDISGMALKDYHRLVRVNYQMAEGRPVTGPPATRRLAAYLPFVLMVLCLILGAGIILMR